MTPFVCTDSRRTPPPDEIRDRVTHRRPVFIHRLTPGARTCVVFGAGLDVTAQEACGVYRLNGTTFIYPLGEVPA
jgi:hypothetical protein